MNKYYLITYQYCGDTMYLIFRGRPKLIGYQIFDTFYKTRDSILKLAKKRNETLIYNKDVEEGCIYKVIGYKKNKFIISPELKMVEDIIGTGE